MGLQANVAQPHDLYEEDDDVDAALSELQISLEGSSNPNGVNDITQVPQLADYLRFFKPKRFTLKSFKSLFFVCRDLNLRAYKSSDAAARGIEPVLEVNLKGCEVTPEVNLTQHKYQIKLEIPSAEGMSEMWLRFDTVITGFQSPNLVNSKIFFYRKINTPVGWRPRGWLLRAKPWPIPVTTLKSSQSWLSCQCNIPPVSQPLTQPHWTSTLKTMWLLASSAK